MEYHGKLYAKFGRKYIQLKQTSEDFDNLESENAKLKQENEGLRKALHELRNRQGKSTGGGK